MPNDLHPAWLSCLPAPVPAELTTPAEVAVFELRQAGIDVEVREQPALSREAWSLQGNILHGGHAGVLYGAYELIRAKELNRPVPGGLCKPYYDARMIDCWDNMDGTVERGYAGRSLWFEGNRFSYDPARIRQLGRMLASVGLNVLCISNVNVHQPAQELIDGLLPETAAFAALLRPFGVRLMLSVDFSQPMQHGVPTADPLDPRVQAWWAERAKAIWEQIPDFYGFLVKADSEHRPGPFTYGRSHAEGANMLARAVAPYKGFVVWRAFVYNCQQDWRDHSVDRPCAACDTYLPLDGQFDLNVILQVKNGPYDFQIREPISPTLLALHKTCTAVEFQLAQEYTGHQIDLCTLAPLFHEFFEDIHPSGIVAIAAVSNLGRDWNWFGHPFAAANLFCFGRIAWNPKEDPETCIREWARLSYPDAAEALTGILSRSRAVYELYTGTLGQCWMVNPHEHYGPNPGGYEFDRWGTYHRASRDAVGIDRTAAGTGYVSQYPPELQARYGDPGTCPDELLLFFHRLRYDFVMRDGRTLIQRIYDDHFAGAEEAEKMAEVLKTLPLPEPDRTEALKRMDLQVANARAWRDVINTFFHRLSGVDDAHGRTIYD